MTTPAPVTPLTPATPPVTVTPPAPAAPGAPALPPGAILAPDAFRAATPYNATVVGRAAPNPAYSRPNMTLPCVNPNQNFAPLELTPPECIGRFLNIFHSTHLNSGCGCGGSVGGCDGFLPAGGCGAGGCGGSGFVKPVAAKAADAGDLAQVGFWPFKKSGCEGGDCGVGSCATCSNTANFIFGSSRSFFGESSREFFERPPAVDGIRHKWNPPPAIYRQDPYNAPPPALAIPVK